MDAIRDANATAHRLLVVGGRRHLDKGNPAEVDAELWTTQLDRLVAYEPAEMIAVVEAGMRVGELERILAEGGQEWPSDAPSDATVGGVIASGASSPRRLRFGALRDTVLEAEIVTGDGRLVRSGARTVKNVTGYDLHKLVAGSLGTLGVIVQVALKVRPLPHARRTLRFEGDLALARELVDAVHGSTAVLATPGAVELRLEGWPEEVEEQTLDRSARRGGDRHRGPRRSRSSDRGRRCPSSPRPRSRPRGSTRRSSGTRGARSPASGSRGSGSGRRTASSASSATAFGRSGGIAPVVRGPGGLGDAPVAAPQVQRRLKEAFDPNGVLAPGRGWGGAEA